MRSWGFTDAQVTGPGPDAGIDVRATGAVAQVKFQGAQTSRPTVQKLVGAAGRTSHDQLFFFARSGYFQPALQFAEKEGVRAFVLNSVGIAEPVTSHARAVVQRARTRPTPPPPRPRPTPKAPAAPKPPPSLTAEVITTLLSAALAVWLVPRVVGYLVSAWSDPANRSGGALGVGIVITALGVALVAAVLGVVVMSARDVVARLLPGTRRVAGPDASERSSQGRP